MISLVLLATSAGSFEIYCESVENCWSTTYCCVMQHHAFIWTEGTTIANRDKSVTEVHFTSNRNIRFLPILLHESFPNLRFYAADKCIVEKVQKSNFELLVDLVEINLAENRISALLSDTFEGLRRLEIISLCELRWKKLFLVEKNIFSICSKKLYQGAERTVIWSFVCFASSRSHCQRLHQQKIHWTWRDSTFAADHQR